MPWQPTKIRWAKDPLETSTGATQVETDKGPAYAKFMGNPEGQQALFCELVGTRAAAWLGLPTFDVAVVEVPEAGLVTYQDGSKSLAGPAFVTRREDGSPWGGNAEELTAVDNPQVFAGLIVLDTWLLNCDRFRPEKGNVRRNTRNVFLDARESAKGKLRVIAMDHTHCFTCGWALTRSIGNIDRVKDARLYGHFTEFRPYLTHDLIHGFGQRLLGLSKEAVESFFVGVPSPWDVPPEVRQALMGFLRGRATFVGQNVRQMLVEHGELQPQLNLGR